MSWLRFCIIVLAVLILQLTHSAQVPSSVASPPACRSCGYIIDGDYCLLPNQQKCRLADFDSQACGAEYYCLGQQADEECVSGLERLPATAIASGTDCGEQLREASTRNLTVCAQCGNGKCEAKYENYCNCPEDCGKNTNTNSRCLGEGEPGSWHIPTDQCCEALQKIPQDKNTIAGCVASEDPTLFFCAHCGNGTCGPGENPCNCPEDCGSGNNTESAELKTQTGNNPDNNPGISESEALEKAAAIMTTEGIEMVTENDKPVYLVTGYQSQKLAWLLPIKVPTTVEIDSETGDITITQKPWWKFLSDLARVPTKWKWIK